MPRFRCLWFLILFLAVPALARDVDLKTPLPVDPGIATMGRLPNGMSYWIREHKTPPGKVGMMFHISSGSLNEADTQRGIAHFLEHMAFNGSKNFAPGTMVDFFESMGMRFGQHQNAFTNYDQTTYMMSLPDPKPETMEKAMLYFADVGHRLLLTSEEIDKERGVILEEKRMRSGSGMRLMEKQLPVLLPGARVQERIPIGLESVIKGAPREQFVAYYRKWYRPQRATLLVVGDVDPAVVEGLIKKMFSDWKPDSEEEPEDADTRISPTSGLSAAVFTDKEVGQAQVGLNRVSALSEMKTLGDYRRALVEGLGDWIVNRRYTELVQKGGTAMQSGAVGTQRLLGQCEIAAVDAASDAAKWKDALNELVREVLRAQAHGFLDAELEEAKKATMAGAEQAANSEQTRRARGLLMGMNRAVARGRKPMSPSQRLDLLKTFLPEITRQEVEQTFRATYGFSTDAVVLAVFPEKEGFTPPTNEELLAAAKAAMEQRTEKIAGTQRKDRLMAQDPQPGRADVISVTFENGVRCHVRAMDFRKGQGIVLVNLDGGKIQESPGSLGISRAGSIALAPRLGATQSLSSTDILRLMTGKKVMVAGGESGGTMAMRIMGDPSDWEDGFRLAHLLLTQPKVEEVSLNLARQQVLQMLAAARSDVTFHAQNAVSALLSGDDPRFAVPSTERINAITAEEATKWITRIVNHAPIELAIVGDFDTDTVLALARKYFGSLPARPVRDQAIEKLRKVKQNAGPMVKRIEVDTITDKAFVELGWRGPPHGERDDARTLVFASQILGTRLNKEIREKRGLTYAIGCNLSRDLTYDGMSRFASAFSADPEKAEEAALVAKQVMLGMLENGPTPQEMDAVRKQLRNILETQMKTPIFWAQVLSSMQTRGRTLEDIRSLLEKYTSVTREEIAAVLERYFREDRFYQVTSVPKKT